MRIYAHQSAGKNADRWRTTRAIFAQRCVMRHRTNPHSIGISRQRGIFARKRIAANVFHRVCLPMRGRRTRSGSGARHLHTKL